MNSCDRIVNSSQRSGLLFLHGFIGDASEFAEVGKSFERSHTVVYAQLPGHGSSKIGPDDSLCKVAQGYMNLLHRQTKTKNWHVVGYSLGGRIALYMACEWPEIVNRLTLISASPGIADAFDRRERDEADQLLAKRIAGSQIRSFLSFWYAQKLFRTFQSCDAFFPTFKRRLQNDPEQLAKALELMSVGKQPSLWNHLAKLKMPIRLICGKEDSKYCDIALKMSHENSAIKTTVVERAGHVVHLENAKAVLSRIFDDEYERTIN